MIREGKIQAKTIVYENQKLWYFMSFYFFC